MFILSNNLCVFLPKARIHVTVKLSNTRDLFFLFFRCSCANIPALLLYYSLRYIVISVFVPSMCVCAIVAGLLNP